MVKKQLFAGMLILFLTACTATQSPLTSTSTSSPILPPSITPPATPSPTPTLLPTPVPEIRLKTGEHALSNGDYDSARMEFQTALSTASDPEMRAAAYWGLGRVEYAANNNANALTYLTDLVSDYQGNIHAAQAYFLLGKIYMYLEKYTQAAQSFKTYLSLRPGVLDSFVQELCGDAYISAGDYPNAISAYKIAQAAPHTGDNSALQIKLAQAYASSGDTTTAFNMYESIAKADDSGYIKAQIDLLAGRQYLSLGQADRAYNLFQDAVNQYPLAYDSYSALVALVNANIPVDELNRGLVDYFSGHPGEAVDAFQRYITANPDNDGTASYYNALALYSLGNYEAAIKAWDGFIQNYPNNPHWAAAWNGNNFLPGRAYTQWYWLNQYDLAAQTLLTFIKQAPADANAPIYLLEAGRILERGGKLDDAAGIWKRIADEYPSSDLVPNSLFWAGIAYYRNANYSQALLTFQRDLLLSTAVSDQVRSHFWIGKTQQALGNPALAQSAWQQAASLDPTDYYSLRSQDILLKRPAFDPPSATNFSVDLSTERLNAEAWLRVTFNLPPDTDLGTSGTLLSEPRLIRGTELWALGLEDEARLEFEDLRLSIQDNPADTYRLANYLLDLGLYRPAITAIRQVLTLAGMDAQSKTLAAPAYFNHVRYGLYYQDLVVPAAQQTGFDPLFLFSVIRQESLFEGFVHSTAGARGLMQITPDTGQFISDNLGWPSNYKPDDLYRPMISLPLGATYLSQQRLRFNSDFFTTLAAYNAGPEAAPIWRELAGPDSDLFVEVIRFEETRNYIRSIYEIYNMYRTLYGPIP